MTDYETSEKEYMIGEISELTTIPERSIRHWLDNGLPHRKYKRVIFIKKSDLDAFMDEYIEVVLTYQFKKEPQKKVRKQRKKKEEPTDE